jgi:uncharacterized membrane protein
MKRIEAVIAAAVAYFMLSAGLVWRFGFYGLVGPAVALLICTILFADLKE